MMYIQENTPSSHHEHYSYIKFCREQRVTLPKRIEQNYFMLICEYGNCSLLDIMNYRRQLGKPWKEKAILNIFSQLV